MYVYACVKAESFLLNRRDDKLHFFLVNLTLTFFFLLYVHPPPSIFCSMLYKVLAVLGAAVNLPDYTYSLPSPPLNEERGDDESSAAAQLALSLEKAEKESQSWKKQFPSAAYDHDGSSSSGHSSKSGSSSVLAAVGRALGGGGGSAYSSFTAGSQQQQQQIPSPIKPDPPSSRSLLFSDHKGSDNGVKKSSSFSSSAHDEHGDTPSLSSSSISVPSPIKSAPNMPVSAAMRRFHAQVKEVSLGPSLVALHS